MGTGDFKAELTRKFSLILSGFSAFIFSVIYTFLMWSHFTREGRTELDVDVAQFEVIVVFLSSLYNAGLFFSDVFRQPMLHAEIRHQSTMAWVFNFISSFGLLGLRIRDVYIGNEFTIGTSVSTVYAIVLMSIAVRKLKEWGKREAHSSFNNAKSRRPSSDGR